MERTIVFVAIQTGGGAILPVAASCDQELIQLVGKRILEDMERKSKAGRFKDATVQKLWDKSIAHLRETLRIVGAT